jgi:hypothetical protein
MSLINRQTSYSTWMVFCAMHEHALPLATTAPLHLPHLIACLLDEASVYEQRKACDQFMADSHNKASFRLFSTQHALA